MELTQEQYEQIADAFPKHRGNVKVSNLSALNGILHILEQGCKWRALPTRYGPWHTIYMRYSRWAHNGVLTEVFSRLQDQRIINVEVLGLDSTTIKVHPDGTGALKKSGSQAIGRSRGGLTTKLHMIAADARTALEFVLSPGQDHDGPHGRRLLRRLGTPKKKGESEQLRLFLVADRAYEAPKHANWPSNWATHPQSRPRATGPNPGHTTAAYTGGETRSSGSSAGSRPTGASSPDTTNSTSSS